MTAVEVLKRDERAETLTADPIIALKDEAVGPIVSLEDELPPSLTAPAIVKNSRKKARKYTILYRETFGDSQNNPTAGIKRGKAGGIL
jgi:hypothetical protein